MNVLKNKKNTPECPDCKIKMQIKEAKTGKRKGNKFWGCPNYFSKKCKYTIDIGEKNFVLTEHKKVSAPTKKEFNRPISWSDRVIRKNWYSDYISISGVPSFLSEIFRSNDLNLERALSHTYIIENQHKEKASSKKNQKMLFSILSKIIQRGTNPLCTYNLENECIKKYNLKPYFTNTSDNQFELSNSLKEVSLIDEIKNNLVDRLCNKANFSIDDQFIKTPLNKDSLFDSEREIKFLIKWVPENLGEDACHWFIPQPNFDQLLFANGFDEDGMRRLDFIFYHPRIDKPIAIEIDGGDHKDLEDVDSKRDEYLEKCGFQVVRIPNNEIDSLQGPVLGKLKELCSLCLCFKKDDNVDSNNNIVSAIIDCNLATKIQYSIIRSIKYSWLNLDSEEWFINIEGMGDLAAFAINDILDMAKQICNIYELGKIPKTYIRTDENNFCIDDKISIINEIPDKKVFLNIKLEQNKSPYSDINLNSDCDYHLIVRSAYLPFDIEFSDRYYSERINAKKSNISNKEINLEVFLQNFFRKRSFRESQKESIFKIISGIDTVILLPTGSGKSIIYQISGLIMPGITIVIDPLTSLAEDQERGLLSYGINRVTSISRNKNDDTLISMIRNGEFIFILHSPERLNIPEYRETLKELGRKSLINLAVIDEAHCVSEWGHDFRPAYLNISKNIRNMTKDINSLPAPITALTGTASRSVLNNVIIDLEIKNIEESLVRPISFDRKEIKYFVKKVSGEDTSNSSNYLKNTIEEMADRFEVPSGNFFKSNNKKTYSGVVFVPFVAPSGREYGIRNTEELIKKVTKETPVVYCGSSPYETEKSISIENEWEGQKRVNAKKFIDNDSSILVATKAFGMGIDKPNIRYTIHYGVPNSIEMYVQESGRAGRDRETSYCGIVFSENDQRLNNEILRGEISFEEMSKLYDERKYSQSDDIDRLLFFHFNNFRGRDEEYKQIRELISELFNGDINPNKDFIKTINFSKQKEKEKSLYRLLRIGVIKDYEVNYGRKFFRVYVNKVNLNSYKDHLLAFIKLTEPGRYNQMKESLSNIEESNSRKMIYEMAKKLIFFIYENIEKARRNSIREITELARNANKDNEIRKRILAYLEEGFGSEEISNIIDDTDIFLSSWIDLIDKIETPLDSQQLRGHAIRQMESSARHPGLLLIRAITELYNIDGDSKIASNSFKEAFLNSSDYSIDYNQWLVVFEWMIKKEASMSEDIIKCFIYSFYQLSENNEYKDFDKLEREFIFVGKEELVDISNIFKLSSHSDKMYDLSLIIKNTLRNIGV
jgi:ATP-dependent DNA helicase RecQ